MSVELNTIMKNLGVPAPIAEEILKFDKQVDKMHKIQDINADLTDEQKKIAKKARAAERKKTVYKFDTSKKEKKVNEPKKEILTTIINSLGELDEINIINDEREVDFVKDGVKYKIILSMPRAKKK